MDKACKALHPFGVPSACFDTIRKNSNENEIGADECYGERFSPFTVKSIETKSDQTTSSDKLSYIKVMPTTVSSGYPEAL